MILAAALLLGAPAGHSAAYRDAMMGTKLAGDTISLKGLVGADGQRLETARLPHIVRAIVFLEPLARPEGLARLAWWQTNAALLAGQADLLLVASGSAPPASSTAGQWLIDDAGSLLAARFGALRLWDGKLGAQPLVFVLDDSHIIRAVIEPASAKVQSALLRAAISRLRRQLAIRSSPY